MADGCFSLWERRLMGVLTLRAWSYCFQSMSAKLEHRLPSRAFLFRLMRSWLRKQASAVWESGIWWWENEKAWILQMTGLVGWQLTRTVVPMWRGWDQHLMMRGYRRIFCRVKRKIKVKFIIPLNFHICYVKIKIECWYRDIMVDYGFMKLKYCYKWPFI